MKKEIVIFPNPNQLIALREIQKKLCATFSSIPILPICIKCEKLSNINEKITGIAPVRFVFKDGHVKIEVKMSVNNKETLGYIDYYIQNNEKKETSLPEIAILKIKKFSPFRIAEIVFEEFENGITWKILSEKWGKF